MCSCCLGPLSLQIPTPAIHDASRLASRILLSFFIHSTNSTMPHLLLYSCLSMMHSFLIYIDSIESQAALNHLQPTLIACNTLKLCDFKMCLHIQDLGRTRCPAEEGVGRRIAAKGSFLPRGHFDQPSRNRAAHLQGHPRVPQVEACTVLCRQKR